eukprot:gene11359-8080_t
MIPLDVLLATFCVLAVATGIVGASTLLSVYSDAVDEDSASGTNHGDNPIASGHEEVSWAQALTFPVIASASLLSLYFFFPYLQYVLVVMLTTGSASALYQLLLFIANSRLESRWNSWLAGAATVAIVTHWLMTGNWISHNTLCVALCVLFIHTLRFPSFKIIAACLSLLLLYDAFWVFCSEYIFERNVMVTVAVQKASNPIRDAVSLLGASETVLRFLPRTVELPLKLIFPVHGRYMMLGLGDVALPGAVVAFALRCDVLLQKHRASSLQHDDSLQSEAVPLLPGDGGLLSVAEGTRRPPGVRVECDEYSCRLVGAEEALGTADIEMRRLDDDQQFRTPIATRLPTAVHRLQCALWQAKGRGSDSAASHLFATGLLSYFVGLAAAFCGNFLFEHAQPALIYLVPSVLLSISVAAARDGSFAVIWDGVDQYFQNEMANHHRQ